jgi:hypothetical protein
LTSFDSSGFTVGSDSDVNGSTYPIVSWTWDAGSSTVTNTAGSISSQVRANATAGFSIVTYTGTGSNATVGHGLGVAPQLVIVKRRNAVYDWIVGHTSLGGWGYWLYLNLTNAKDGPISTIFQSTAPTSTVFSVGTSQYTNGSSGTFVAYCWAPVAGYSAFGSYTGNGSSDGPFVATSMRPRWLMVKRTDTFNAADWVIVDAARIGYNIDNKFLFPNGSYAESAGGTSFDLLSNGFKARGTNAEINASGGTYVYACFAESPFQYARAR